MSDQITVEAKEKKKALPTVLEETLLVEIIDPKVGTDAFGNTRKMVLSRAAYDAQKKETQMRIVEVLKPEGVTMAQHNAAKVAKPAPAAAVKAAPAPAPKAAAKPKSKTGAPAPKPKPAAPAPKPKPAAPVAAAEEEGMTADELKLAIEEQSMKELLENAAKTE